MRERTQLALQRNDFKLEQLPPHLLMNFRVIDEHGRQLGTGRHLSSLKAELGVQARTAFQALAALKLPDAAAASKEPGGATSSSSSATVAAPTVAGSESSPARGVQAVVSRAAPAKTATSPTSSTQRYTTWSFAALPELMEIRRGAQVLVGFPALIDCGDGVEIEVFDEPDIAAAKHRAGLRRLVALQLKEPLKYLEKNLPELQKMGAA